MYSDKAIHRWTQSGGRDGNGTLTFFSEDDKVVLSMDLHAHNRLYFYGLDSRMKTTQDTTEHATSYTVSSESDAGTSGAPRGTPPTPQRTPVRKTPVTLGYQLDSELWSVRLGSPGEASMHELAKGKALGIPNEF